MTEKATAVALTRGERMHLAMFRAGVDGVAMARQLHVNRKTLARWCRDEGSPNPIILERFAEICGVPPEWFDNVSVADNYGGDPGGIPTPITSANSSTRTRPTALKGRKRSTSGAETHSYPYQNAA